MKTKIINAILAAEGGYTNDPTDSGGATRFGITENVARAYGYFDSMKELSRDTAFVIYADKYWNSVRGDDLLALSEAVAAEVVDTAVNMGVKRAGKFLQRSLNALNDRGRLYDDITVDGNVGPVTVARLKTCLLERDESVLVKMLNCLQGAFYVELAERREKDERFIYGWFKNRVS
jgi:lysozyme family protein